MHDLKNHSRNYYGTEFRWAKHSMNKGRVIRTQALKVFLEYINSSFFWYKYEKVRPCSKGLNSPTGHTVKTYCILKLIP